MRLRYEKCMAGRVFKEPLQKVNENYMLIDNVVKRIQNSIIIKYKDKKLEAIKIYSKLDALSPLKTLSRGYSITEQEGKIVKSVAQLKKDNIITLRFEDGKCNAKVL